MKAKQLKEYLKDVPDDVEIVVPGRDHSFVSANFRIDTAISTKYGLSEDPGEIIDDERVVVVVIN